MTMSSSARAAIPRPPQSPCATGARSISGQDTPATTVQIPHGINIRELLVLWRSHGGIVEAVHRAGEIRLRHPGCPSLKSSKFSQNRKDSTRDTVLFVRRILSLLAATHGRP